MLGIHNHLSNTQFCHLLTSSSLARPEVPLTVSPVSFYLLICSFLVFSLIYCGASVCMLQPISSVFLHFVQKWVMFCSFPNHLLGIIRQASSCETYQWLEFILNGLRTQRRLSPAVGFLPLASRKACFGMVSSPFLMKQLHRSG